MGPILIDSQDTCAFQIPISPLSSPSFLSWSPVCSACHHCYWTFIFVFTKYVSVSSTNLSHEGKDHVSVDVLFHLSNQHRAQEEQNTFIWNEWINRRETPLDFTVFKSSALNKCGSIMLQCYKHLYHLTKLSQTGPYYQDDEHDYPTPLREEIERVERLSSLHEVAWLTHGRTRLWTDLLSPSQATLQCAKFSGGTHEWDFVLALKILTTSH